MNWTALYRFLIAVSVALIACSSAFVGTAQAQINRLPERTTILQGASARPLFKQCSRPSPAWTAFWTPTASDVRRAEQALPGFIELLKNRNGPDRRLRFDYRQYAGFVDKSSGHKCLYLNGFAPRIAEELSRSTTPGKKRFDWQREPVDACDGGNSFWGAEYDVQTKRWLHFSTNGR